jgi:hypothetical protein
MRLIKTTNQRTCFLTQARTTPAPQRVAYVTGSHPKDAHFAFMPVNRPVILLKKRGA